MATGSALVALAVLGGLPGSAMAAAPEWVGPTKLVLDPLLLFFEFAFVARIILSWYPAVRLRGGGVLLLGVVDGTGWCGGGGGSDGGAAVVLVGVGGVVAVGGGVDGGGLGLGAGAGGCTGGEAVVVLVLVVGPTVLVLIYIAVG